MKEIKSPTEGTIGFLHEMESDPNTVLIVQLPRETKFLSTAYLEHTRETLSKILPEGKTALLIGADVNIYEIAGVDALSLKIKGLI
jgi:hypothetical protein